MAKATTTTTTTDTEPVLDPVIVRLAAAITVNLAKADKADVDAKQASKSFLVDGIHGYRDTGRDLVAAQDHLSIGKAKALSNRATIAAMLPYGIDVSQTRGNNMMRMWNASHQYTVAEFRDHITWYTDTYCEDNGTTPTVLGFRDYILDKPVKSLAQLRKSVETAAAKAEELIDVDMFDQDELATIGAIVRAKRAWYAKLSAKAKADHDKVVTANKLKATGVRGRKS